MHRKPAILVVDDEENITRTLQMVFEQQGYDVITAYSSAQAVKILENGHKLDAVITDLNMEREDIGLEVARVAQRLRPRPVIVICTGFANPKNSLEALKMHVDYLANKPVDIDELTAALRRLITRRQSEHAKGQR
jgi:two-component system, NtrC family, response regulator HydG